MHRDLYGYHVFPLQVVIGLDRPGIDPTRGWSSAPMRHGVSTIRSGRRHTLGLAFHDAA